MESTSSKKSQSKGASSSEFSHEPNSANFVPEYVPSGISSCSDAIIIGHQGIYSVEEYTFPSDEINELQSTGSPPGSQAPNLQYATNSVGERIQSGTSYLPESTLISNPMMITAEENFSPLERTIEIVVPGINPRSNENIFNLRSSIFSQQYALSHNVYSESNPWEKDTSNVQQMRNITEERVSVANETNRFEFTGNRLRPEGNLFNFPPVGIFSGSQHHPLPAYSYPQTGLLNYDTSENVFSSQISSANNITARNYNQNISSHMQDCFVPGTSYCPEIVLSNQQSMNIAEEIVFPSQQVNELEVTEGSAKSKENLFDVPHSSTSFRFQENAFSHHFYSEPKLSESGMSNELQRKNSAKENVFPTYKTNQFEFIGNTEGSEKNHFKIPPDNIVLDAHPHASGTYSISESGSKKCGKSDEKCDSQVPFNVNSVYESGEKRHECETCKKRFHTRSGLRDHERVHTRERPYECEICRRLFTQKSNLNTHLLIHTGEKAFECQICNRRFARKQELTRHDRRVHKEEGL